MISRIRPALLLVAMAGLLVACASSRPSYQPKPFTPAPIDTKAFVPAVGSFVILLDASSSMAEERSQKFFAAKDTANAMNQTIPELGYQGAFATFGPGCLLNKGLAKVHYGPAVYSTADLGAALDGIECAGGVSPMDLGIIASGVALDAAPGSMALIVISDYQDIDAKAAGKALKTLNADGRVCFHGVQVGGNTKGTALRNELAGMTNCGSSVDVGLISSTTAMAECSSRMLLAAARRQAVVRDSDGDGVPDDRDRCPGTPAGARVNQVGCWWVGDETVLFDFDKADIKSTFMLDEAVEILKANPEVKVEVQGHTDNVGDPDYNLGLSQRRAVVVRDYMIRKGIDPNRLRATGYGMTRPHFSNDSEQGRALNRRVELHPYE